VKRDFMQYILPNCSHHVAGFLLRTLQ